MALPQRFGRLGAALAGGTAPLIATWLLHEFNNDWHPIAIYIIIAAAISLLAVAFAPAIARREAANEAALEATNASTTTS